jgi:hypothetical protein
MGRSICARPIHRLRPRHVPGQHRSPLSIRTTPLAWQWRLARVKRLARVERRLALAQRLLAAAQRRAAAVLLASAKQSVMGATIRTSRPMRRSRSCRARWMAARMTSARWSMHPTGRRPPSVRGLPLVPLTTATTTMCSSRGAQATWHCPTRVPRRPIPRHTTPAVTPTRPQIPTCTPARTRTRT